MHHSARTAPVTGSTRPRSPGGALLAAVVLAVLATLGIATPPPGAPHPAFGGAPVAADQYRYDGTCADDGCDATCVVRMATRPEPHGEHPASRGHLGTCGRSVDATPCPVPGPYGAPAGHVPSSPPHTAQDQGRAPPVFSGT
ncbi:hypothetical protein [Streptomyces sp. NPDC012466]|uniref:hypothetical protein n=1 Tax=Streptomyces sp. NPDC012466 TaxID=3364835 RepID=UPI0036E050E6